MNRYETTVSKEDINTSHAIELRLIGEDKTVLDIGCSSGFLADALAKQGCAVSGVEYDPETAEMARPKLQRLVVADITVQGIDELFPDQRFDAIVFGDILEHTPDPARVLRSSLGCLAEDGRVVISVPNVAHGALRLALLTGKWAYTDTGLLDRTHIHFFTWASLVQMLTDLGLAIDEAVAKVLDPMQTEVSLDVDPLPVEMVEWVRDQPHSLDYQFIVRAHPGDTGANASVVPTPAVPLDEIRLTDIFTSRLKDARERERQLKSDLAAATTKIEWQDQEVGALANEVSELHQSHSYKLGHSLLAPVRLAQRVPRLIRDFSQKG